VGAHGGVRPWCTAARRGERFDLRVPLAGGAMKAFREHRAVADDDGADHRVRRGQAARARRDVEGALHEAFVVGH
jgi:hypothetical protein